MHFTSAFAILAVTWISCKSQEDITATTLASIKEVETPEADQTTKFEETTKSVLSSTATLLEDEAKDSNPIKRLANKTLKFVTDDWDRPGWLQLPPNYNKEEIPQSHNQGKPLTVAVFINIRAINAIDMRSEKFTVDMDLYEFWADNRFHTNASLSGENKGKESGQVLVEVQKLDSEFAEKLWSPDLILENTVLIPHNDVTREPLVSFNSVTGFVRYSRLEVTSPCAMSYHFYPLDIQTCTISIRSYKHLSNHLELEWVHHGVYFQGATNPNYDIKVETAYVDRRSIRTISFPNLLEKIHLDNIIWADKSVDVLNFAVAFRRNLSFHMVQTFLPSSFFIVITWLTYFLPQSMAASKIGITMTTLLTINTMFNSVREHSPKVSYCKAIDVWMIGCVFFTFLALGLFTLQSWLDMVKEREEKRKKDLEEEEKEKTVHEETKSQCVDGGRIEGIILQFHPMKIPSHIKLMNPAKLAILLKIRKFFKRQGLNMLAGLFIIFDFIYWAGLCMLSSYFTWTVNGNING